MNAPKFVQEDSDLFRLLLTDLFPGLELNQADYGKLQEMIELKLAEQGSFIVNICINNG